MVYQMFLALFRTNKCKKNMKSIVILMVLYQLGKVDTKNNFSST